MNDQYLNEVFKLNYRNFEMIDNEKVWKFSHYQF
jgi:hypothetical protein